MTFRIYENGYYGDDLIRIKIDKDDENEICLPGDSNMSLLMYEFMRHKGLIPDFKQYIKNRQFIEHNKQGITDGMWQMRRNAELKNLFSRLKKANPDMVDDIINDIHYRLDHN